MKARWLIVTVSLLPLFGAASLSYHDEISKWRLEREEALRADGGWLSVAGLFWLKEGANTIGTAANAAIRLPRGPARASVIEYRAGKAKLHAETGAGVTVNGKVVVTADLHSDANEAKPDRVQVGDVALFVIHRGQRDAVRMKDPQSAARVHFTGLHWYPIRDDYRVTAQWTAYDPPKTLSIPNVLGEVEQTTGPGYASFKLNGQDCQLEPVVEDGQLFFVFKDQTAGKETYPAGRFLYAAMPKDGRVALDFNKAYNPPCAFTPFATCPLPTKQNRLPVRVEAGELNYGKH